MATALINATTETTVNMYMNVILSNLAVAVLTTLTGTILGNIFALCGLVTNGMTMLVLAKQGFTKTINISMMGLALSDFCSCWFVIGLAVIYNPWFQALDLDFDQWEFPYLTLGWPQYTGAHITGWITAFITVERCLCVAIPLIIKRVLTPGRHLGIVISIYLGVIAGTAPVYFTSSLARKFYQARNRSIIGLIFTSDKEKVEVVSFAINNIFSPLASFIITISCTAILVSILIQKSSWRQGIAHNSHHKVTDSASLSQSSSADEGWEKSTAPPSLSTLSFRDAKVIKLVILLAIIFVISATPRTVWFVWASVDNEASTSSQRQDIPMVVNGVATLFETVNCSVTIFVYLYMSASFRETFFDLLKRCQKSGSRIRHI